MKLVKLIGLLLFLLLAISLVASALAAWNSYVSSEHVRKVSLSYQVHGHVLSLKSKTYQLFKQLGDSLIIGDLDQGEGEGEAKLIAEIRDTLNKARATISLEMQFYGEDEIEELEELAATARTIEYLISELTRISKAQNRDGTPANKEELWRLLDGEMAEQISRKTKNLTSENKALEDTANIHTRQLEQLVSDLKKSDENRQRMLADVSHELRTPLTIIRGEAEIALRGGVKPVEVYQEALVRARDAAEHTARLVDDLLFVARNESGQARLKVHAMDLAEAVQETMATFGCGVIYLPDVDVAPMRGDVGRIRQALLILLENARYHGGSEITVRLTQTPDGYRVAIEDNGPGMTDEEKAHAFERFFRGPNAADRYREGLGLGLPVALSIAQAHGGSIELQDRMDGGLVAALMLPAQPVLKVVA